MNLEYTPIRDYAAIGDCHGSALAGRDGGIDWCALARFDADPVFCRLLERAAQLFDDAPLTNSLASRLALP